MSTWTRPARVLSASSATSRIGPGDYLGASAGAARTVLHTTKNCFAAPLSIVVSRWKKR